VDREARDCAAHRTLTARAAGICAALIALLATSAPANTADAAFAAATRTVPCDESIDTTPFPYIGNSQPQYRYRSVLNAIAVPPAYLQQVVATRQQSWRYWRKAGLVVRARRAVTIPVPPHWRTRVAIVWGNSGGPFASLRIAACAGSPHSGNAYAGGFYLRSSSACLPLIFTVAGRSTTVRFGIGTRCGGPTSRG
jgi:hypothetical protein